MALEEKIAVKWVYSFGNGRAEGNASMRDLLGGKGAGLAEMTNLGLPVPPGFTITTEAGITYLNNKKKYPEGLKEQIEDNIIKLEGVMGQGLGDSKIPLLVSVRSGAKDSMPGMMDTVLNVGLTNCTIDGFASKVGERAALDTARRLRSMFGSTVMGVEKKYFDALLDETKRRSGNGVKNDTDLTVKDLSYLIQQQENLIKEQTGKAFPQDAREQLYMAINAVFDSWNGKRAIEYRNLYEIPHNWGTAANIVVMAFGNSGENSGTGVAFTRDPSTGDRLLKGEILFNAQGEDVVAGIRTPLPISALKERMPKVYAQFIDISQRLEGHYKNAQDVEFTIEDGRLYMLQTRNAKRTPFASVKMAVDMLGEGLIGEKEALKRIDVNGIEGLLSTRFDPNSPKDYLTQGINASKGEISGIFFLDAKDVMSYNKSRGKKDPLALLVRKETSPEDVKGMFESVGILTQIGGYTSHAAVVARQMGKVCVVGCQDLEIDQHNGILTVKGRQFKAGKDIISLSGDTGKVYAGEIPVTESDIVKVLRGELEPSKSPIYKNLSEILKYANAERKLGVWANAETKDQIQDAKMFGAEGIGLVRTEHMFFEGKKIDYMRQMIVAKSPEERQQALYHLQELQKDDFKMIYMAMINKDGKPLPATVRLLDPPLHEFLPKTAEEIDTVAKLIGVSTKKLEEKIEQLHEFNPMIGMRGCRLGITYPGITATQVAAGFDAASEVSEEIGTRIKPYFMIPNAALVEEFLNQRHTIDSVAERKGYGKEEYQVGTMIETPRAAVLAGEFARNNAQFFSFGTNDLTQLTFGMSRDDYGKFCQHYLDNKIFPNGDPFQSIDKEGVGQLVVDAVRRIRAENPHAKIGVCGEHGGNPASVEFFHGAGLDYVSCSPWKLMTAQLAAAQAAQNSEKGYLLKQ